MPHTSLRTPLALAVSLLATPALAEGGSSLNDALQAYHVALAVHGDLPLTRDFRQPAMGKTFHTLVGQADQLRVEMEIITPLNPEECAAHLHTQYKAIVDLYGPQTIPYPGAVTHSTECPEALKPTTSTATVLDQSTDILVANASERFVLGVCDADLIANQAVFAATCHEETDTYYQITIFQPAEHSQQEDALLILQSLAPIP